MRLVECELSYSSGYSLIFAELPAPLPSSNLDFLSEFDYVSSPVPSPIVAGTGVAGTGVPGPGVAGSGLPPAAPDASRVVASGNLGHLLRPVLDLGRPQ